MDRVIIAETGVAPGDLSRRHGGYGQMMIDMLKASRPSVNTAIVPVYIADSGEIPPPAPGTSLLITGSPAGVYEDHEWIAPLEAATRAYLAAGCRVVGICFGHQLMAQALGGRVEKSAKGWGVGVHTYESVPSAATVELPPRFSCAVSHQDQVIELPADSQRLAGSDFCENGAISYANGLGLSFQMHPEFTAEFGQALLSARADRIPEETYRMGQASYGAPSTRHVLGRLITEFLVGD